MSQTTAGVYFSDDSRVDHTNSLPSYAGDGNIYNPAGAGFVATVMVGTTPTNFTNISDYAKYWYTLQYGTAIITAYGINGGAVGYRSEQRSWLGAPEFVASAGGDFRLAATVGNLTDFGADYVYKRALFGGYPTLWDAQGTLRAQGNAIDVGAYETAGPISRSFTLTTAANTSAGVFDASGKLVRTLWNGLRKPAGTVTVYWNGLDDDKHPVAYGNYTIKLLTNNLQYVWDGGMANSVPLTGPNIETSYAPFLAMVFVGNTAYYAAGYNEGRYQLYKFDLSNIHQTTGRAVGTVNYYDKEITAIATDSTAIYTVFGSANTASNPDPNKSPTIKAYDLNYTELRSLDIGVTTLSNPAGIAVQAAGAQNLLFVSDPVENKVYLFNKSTFAAYSTPYLDGSVLGWNSPQAMVATASGDLWLACKNTASGQWQVLRYTNFGGTPTLAATITGLAYPAGLTISLDGTNTLMIADSESGANVHQQVKAYNSVGTQLWTLGQLGGYATNGPAVASDKFILSGLIAAQPDGSFWVTDLGAGNRVMHFNAARVFTPGDDITFAQSYTVALDQNNSARLFQTSTGSYSAGGLGEYLIDYTKPYVENQGWTPVKNWGYINGQNILSAAQRLGIGLTFTGLNSVTTLSNGRTYAIINTGALEAVTNPSAALNDTSKVSLVELTATGLRDTGYSVPNGYWLDKDGSFIYNTQTNGNYVAYRLSISSINASGNPQYANPAVQVASIANVTTWDHTTPAVADRPYGGPSFLDLGGGQLAVYSPLRQSAGNHLGVIDQATNTWQWQSMTTSGPLNGRGNDDSNGWYTGNRATTDGNSIIAGYNGEGWVVGGEVGLGQGQANQFMQYSKDGLFLGQFGTPYLIGSSYANGYGVGGNSLTPQAVVVNGVTYMFVCDEGHRSAMRWHIEGQNTIQEQSATVAITTAAVVRHAGTGTSTTYGAALSFDVTVSGASPTGTVTLYDGGPTGTVLGTGTLTSGTCTITPALNALAVGAHPNIVGVYNGDANNTASTSSVLTTQTVSAKALTAGLTGTVSKIYDGTTTATLTVGNYTLPGIISGDT
ncbi:MAG: Ig-like domain repeat protein, partial [Phycisphaerae bacterium]